MALKRMVLQIGMGTDIRGRDYTKAAVRALRDALWHNSLSVANALGQPVDAMRVEVTIGVPHPELVDKAAVLAVLPHGTGTVTVVEGGLEIANDEGTNATVVANAAAVVRLDLPEAPAVSAEAGHHRIRHRQRSARRRLHKGRGARRAGRDPSQLAEPDPQPRHRFAHDAGRGHDRRAAAGPGQRRHGQGGAAARPGHASPSSRAVSTCRTRRPAMSRSSPARP